MGIILKLLGWKVKGDWGVFKKYPSSITVVAPHTSYWDGVIGKIALISMGIKHTILSARHLFWFPFNLVLKYILGAIPIGGRPGSNSIMDVVNYLKTNNSHIIICPEGQLAPTNKWNPGFYYMAIKAEVPIIMVDINYKTRTITVLGVIDPVKNFSINEVFKIFRSVYYYTGPKHLNKFSLPKIKEGN